MNDFQNRLARVEDLIGALDGVLDPASRGRVQDILGVFLDIHEEGLKRFLSSVSALGDSGRALLEDLGRDEVVGGLLILHGLHPEDLDTRIRRALERVRPQLALHGGNVELVGVDDRGVLRLRLEGSCHGCPSSAATLRTTIESAIQASAPDVAQIVLDEPAPSGAREGAP